MILSATRLREVPAVFRAMTGLQIEAFDVLAADLVPVVAAAEQVRRGRRKRRRAVGGGCPFTLTFRGQLLLTVIWLRQSPTAPVLASCSSGRGCGSGFLQTPVCPEERGTLAFA